MAKKDQFDSFLEKQFGSSRAVTIASPVGGERSTSYEERRRLAGAERAAHENAGEGSGGRQDPSGRTGVREEREDAAPRRLGRPKGPKKELAPLNFFIDKDLKTKLELLKIELYRSSVTDLVKEALHDLLVKYGKE